MFVTLLIYIVTSFCSQQITQWSMETKIIKPLGAGFKVTQKIKQKIEKNVHEFHQSNSQCKSAVSRPAPDETADGVLGISCQI